MRSIRWVIVTMMWLALAGCGGGGGGDNGGGGGGSGGGSGNTDDTSISISQTSLHFDLFGSLNAPAQTVTASFKGAGVVVGTLPGQQLPAWLAGPFVQSSTATQVVFSVQVTPFMVGRGTYTTTLRFVTGRADQTNLKTADLTVTLTVNDPMNATVPGTGTLSFLQLDGDPAGAKAVSGAATIQITGDAPKWHVTANQPWVTFSATSGTQAGNLTVSADRQSLALGTYNALITLTDERASHNFQFPVAFEVRAPRVTVSVPSLTFKLDAQTQNADFARGIGIGDELNGAVPAKAATWTASVDQPWLDLSQTSGSTTTPAAVIASLNVLQRELIPTGTYQAKVTVSYTDSAGGKGTVDIPVALTVRLPVVRSVQPYTIAPNTPVTVKVRGRDFQPEDLANLRIGSVTPTSITRIDSSTLSVAVPSLPQGWDRVYFAHPSFAVSRSVSGVTVANASAIGAGVIESPNVKRIVFDAPRGRILAVDRTQFQLESYVWNGTAWTSEATVAVPEIADVALARGGEDLIIAKRYAIVLADANDLTAPLTPIWARQVSDFDDGALNAIQVNDLGMALIAQTDHFAPACCWSNLVSFDTLRRLVGPSPGIDLVYEPQLAMTHDSRYIAVSHDGATDVTYLLDSYGAGDTLFGSRRDLPWTRYPVSEIDPAGTRFLESGRYVRDLQGALLGTLPSAFPRNFTLLSPDGKRAYRLVDASAPGRIDVYDLTAPPAPDYPVIGNVPLPARVANPTEEPYLYPGATYSLAGTVTPDGKFLILSGPERIVVVDVSGI